MTSNLPSHILEDLKLPFEKILSFEDFGDVINNIASQIYRGELTAETLHSTLRKYGVDIQAIKNRVLDMIISYIKFLLEDNYITSKEAENVNFLKRFFKIIEGDFYAMKYYEVEQILDRQFEHMYQNNAIDKKEALQKVELQELFDLGYDQFLQLSEKAVKNAITRGASLLELDTFVKQN